MNDLIKDIVNEEWEQFQLVNNEGGRCSCQDDRAQFDIMRTSQFMAWPAEVLESYYRDLIGAKFSGQNLIFNKYAYMMEDTDPDGFDRIRSVLPAVSEQRKQLIDSVVAVHLRWAEEFAEKCPKFAGKGRPIHRSEALPGQTSIETYQRGEILSYGSKTQFLYCNFVFSMEAEGRNLTYIIRDNMAKFYGYESAEELERSR